MISVSRPTTMTELTAGPMEYRLERDGAAAVVVFHGGHVRAGIAMGATRFWPRRAPDTAVPVADGRHVHGAGRHGDVSPTVCCRGYGEVVWMRCPVPVGGWPGWACRSG